MQVPPVLASAPARGCDLLLPKLLTPGVWLLALYLLAHSSAALAQARSSCRGYHPPASDELVSESRTWGREKRSHPMLLKCHKGSGVREQVVSDSALRTFVLVALAQHQVLGTSAPAMPIPCSAPFCFPSHATCPQATPCPQEGCHGHGYWCHNGSHGEDRSWVRWKSQQREITKM